MKKAGLALLFLAVASCTNKKVEQQQGAGNNCLPDISTCDVSGNYNLLGTDASPFYVYSATLPITQADLPPNNGSTTVSLAPNFYFYTGSGNAYIFRSVGYGTWDSDSLKAVIHGKLRLSATNYPVVGGFAMTLKLDAKQKTFTNQYYYAQVMRVTLPALDGIMTLSDTAHVIFPALDTPTKALFAQF